MGLENGAVSCDFRSLRGAHVGSQPCPALLLNSWMALMESFILLENLFPHLYSGGITGRPCSPACLGGSSRASRPVGGWKPYPLAGSETWGSAPAPGPWWEEGPCLGARGEHLPDGQSRKRSPSIPGALASRQVSVPP